MTNCFYAHERLFGCLFPELRSNEGNKYQNNTRVGTETVRHESTYIILFLTRHNEHINDDKNNYLYTSSPCLTHSGFVCWWRHDWLLMTSQWPNNCDSITWIVISNSLDIDFIHGDIHGDIHGRPCKKEVFSCPTPTPPPSALFIRALLLLLLTRTMPVITIVQHACTFRANPDSKVHGANMGPTRVLSAQMGPMLAPWTLLSGKTFCMCSHPF